MNTRQPMHPVADLLRLALGWLGALALCLGLLWMGQGQAQAQTAARQFDHLSTGFPLTGAHANERCENCHLNGVFKGTPRDCATCHVSGSRFSRSNVVKSAQHVPTQLSCENCHDPKSFSGARFSHTQVQSGTCATCHNGGAAPGKPSRHIATSASCDSCHRTGAWLPAKGMDHSSFNVATNCASCHNGSSATGKAATHIPTTSNCTSCHSTAGWKPSSWNHGQQVVTGQCASCHSGAFPPADGKSASHVNYVSVASIGNASCDSCHKAGYTAWTPARLHGSFSVSGQCASCHASQKPATAVHAGVTVCETCHKTTSAWTGAKVDHSSFTAATNCSSCHNGSAATGKAGNHIPTTLNCTSCHSTAGWKPSSWNHGQQVVTGQCASCHSGAYPPADGKPANHVNHVAVATIGNASCDSCHKGSYSLWSNGRVHANFTVSTQCASCHSGAALGAVGKPATAVHAGVTACESCHKSTTTWAGAKVDHSTFTAATNCSSCHNGSAATTKPGSHMPTTQNCIGCHTTKVWKPSTWNHTQQVVTAQCSSCHSGAYPPADGRPASHVPYQLLTGVVITNCDSCHKSGTTVWTGARVHANVSLTTQCRTCHTGAYPPAVGAPANATHASLGSTGCETCHRGTSSWAGATFAHSAANAVGTGTCDGCHNGSSAKGKPANHIPVTAATAKCDSCHRSQASFATAVTMNHSAVATQTCKGCHNGAYLTAGTQGALAKPANHIPESQLLNGTAMDCNACHTSTSVFSTVRMNHNGSQGNGSGWCKACHQSGTAFLGSMDKKSLTHEARGTTPTDCSQSGCHRPLGNKGAAYTKWD